MKNIKYKVGHNLFSLFPITIVFLVFGGVTVWLKRTNNGMFIFTGLLTSFLFVILICTLYNHFFKKILIDEEGFYVQNSIGNGRYYKYKDIVEAWESDGKSSNGVINYYLNFKTTDGRIVKFNFTADKSEGVMFLIDKVNGQGENANEE